MIHKHLLETLLETMRNRVEREGSIIGNTGEHGAISHYSDLRITIVERFFASSRRYWKSSVISITK